MLKFFQPSIFIFSIFSSPRFINHKNPLIQMFMGEQGDLGEKLGINNSFAFDIISMIGNYGEIFEMYLYVQESDRNEPVQ